jgi:hypothetical protein
VITEVGTSDFLRAFFSTVSGNWEPEGWGTRFPLLVNKFYLKELMQSDANAALIELETIAEELSKLSLDAVIWDVADRSKRPPQEINLRSSITNLAKYFVTSTQRDVIETLKELIIDLRDDGGTLKVVEVPKTDGQVTFTNVPTIN